MTETSDTDGLPPNRAPTGEYTAYHDWTTDRPLSETILETLERVAGDDLSPTRPVYDSLDLSALDELFSTSGADARPTKGHVVFVHDGYEIAVHADGTVRVRPENANR